MTHLARIDSNVRQWPPVHLALPSFEYWIDKERREVKGQLVCVQEFSQTRRPYGPDFYRGT
jgi:hypothetical protein